ncbi:hypothetical protein KIW84_035773 [Lathyrus oleraceus]|uniref:BED-type domain-containing protein n=1 Tax=Pisum sativum TaxID=3888 RepID=A0A9D4Y2R5_PEA|nr:hypothetical protein KIW84_035773 [Pisum sativum]
MPPREQFPTKGLDGVPSEDIGWYFGTPEPENRNNVRCKLCNVVIKGGITRLKQHIALTQLTLFRENSETFGTPLAHKSWSKMDAAQWWEYHGSCALELQRSAMKVVSQTTFAKNCESEGENGGGDDEGEDDELDPYHETPPNYRRYRNLTDMDHSDKLLIETRGNVSQSERKGKRKQNIPLQDSSSSSITHNFSDFGIGDSSQSSKESCWF